MIHLRRLRDFAVAATRADFSYRGAHRTDDGAPLAVSAPPASIIFRFWA